MPYSFPNNTVNPDDFAESLIKEMGMSHADPAKKEALKKAVQSQMVEVILNAASLHVSPLAVEEVAGKYPEEGDLVYLVRKLIEWSPEAQVAILTALDEFYDQSLNAFESLKK